MTDSNPNVRPMKGCVFLECLEEAEKTTPAGLIIPQTAHGRKRRGLVLAVGPDCTELEHGDIVFYDPYRIRAVLADGSMAQAAGTPIANPSDRFVILEEDVHAVDERPLDPTPSERRWALDILRRHALVGSTMPTRDLLEALDTYEDLTSVTPALLDETGS